MDLEIKSKKQLRDERKRRKIAALLEVSELNDKDKEMTGYLCSGIANDVDPDLDPESKGPKCKKFKSDSAISCPNSSLHTSNQQDDSKSKFSEADLNELRSLLKMRRNMLKRNPLLTLKEPVGSQAELTVPAGNRIPIFFSDIQHLILFAVLAQNSPSMPRWCSLAKCGHLSGVQLLFIEGAGISDYLQNKESLSSLSESNFPIQLEVVMPAAYHGNLVEEFCSIPLSRIQSNNLVTAYGSLKAAVKSSCEVFKVLRAFFPVKQKSDKENDIKSCSNDLEKVESGSQDKPVKKEPQYAKPAEYLPASDQFPRTQLLLSAWQMIEEGYPIPLNASLREKFKDFVPTKTSYKEVNNFSPMYGLDCEMCTTCAGSELTRVSIVNEKLETVLDTLVLPYNRITNYLTRFSGITATMMKDVTTRLQDVQKFIQEKLEPDAILVGQSLNFDLVSLKVMHPYCIDTSVIFNVTGDRYRKSKLKYLSEHFLKESIQTSNKGHCPVEDSSASLRLAQLKLSQSIEFGDQVLSAQEIRTHGTQDDAAKKVKVKEDLSGYATSLFSYASRMGKHVSIMASPEILEKYMDYLNPKIASYEQISEDGSSKIISKDEVSETGHVTCVITPSNESVAEGVASAVKDKFLAMGHIQLSEQESNALSIGNGDVLERLNSWVSEMQRSVPLKTLSIVLLCGREKSANGVCFLKLHTQSHEKVNFKPQELALQYSDSQKS